VKSHQRRIGSP